MKRKWILAMILAGATVFFTACSCNNGNSGEDSSQNGGQNVEDVVPDDGEDATGGETPDIPDSPSDGEDTTGGETPDEPTPVTWGITYKAAPVSAIDDRVFTAIKKRLGEYPESYVEGVGVTVDGLRSDVMDENYLYTFVGWYYDEDCVSPCVDGVIGADKTGNVTLYAKVQKTPLGDVGEEDWGGS